MLANSGIRTGEANKLSVTDVHSFVDDKQRHNYRLVVRGKTGERDAVVRSVAAKRLDKYLAVRRAANPGGLLFVMPDESRVEHERLLQIEEEWVQSLEIPCVEPDTSAR